MDTNENDDFAETYTYYVQVQESNVQEYKEKTKEVAHKVKHYGAFGEEYLGEKATFYLKIFPVMPLDILFCFYRTEEKININKNKISYKILCNPKKCAEFSNKRIKEYFLFLLLN